MQRAYLRLRFSAANLTRAVADGKGEASCERPAIGGIGRHLLMLAEALVPGNGRFRSAGFRNVLPRLPRHTSNRHENVVSHGDQTDVRRLASRPCAGQSKNSWGRRGWGTRHRPQAGPCPTSVSRARRGYATRSSCSSHRKNWWAAACASSRVPARSIACRISSCCSTPGRVSCSRAKSIASSR